MSENGRKFIKKRDIIWIGGLILVCLLGYFIFYNRLNSNSLYAEIYIDTKLVKTLSLDGEDLIFALDENPDIIFERKNGKIGFVESSCPDKICIHSGFLSKSGQMAVCMPNKVVLKIVDKNGNNELDAALR